MGAAGKSGGNGGRKKAYGNVGRKPQGNGSRSAGGRPSGSWGNRQPRRTHRGYGGGRAGRPGSCLGTVLAIVVIAVLAVWVLRTLQTESSPFDKGADDTQDTLLTVHCLDVGQAGATLFISDGHAMLVDAGERKDREMLLEYLEEQGVSTLDYLLLTHPHADHIGSAAKIIREVPVDRVLMPDIGIDDCETAVYADVLAAIDEKEPLVDYPKAGDMYELGNASFRIVCPSPLWRTDKDNLNESSLGILVSCKDSRILVYGDGEKACEAYMTETEDISAEVLLVGHHGSQTSSDMDFLHAVSPAFAVISCGRDNEYGLPHKETLARLNAVNAQIYRTDRDGTVIFETNGKNITFYDEK